MRKRISLVSLTFLLIILVGYSNNLKPFDGYPKQQFNLELSCSVGSCESASKNTSTGVCSGHMLLNAIAIDNCKTNDDLVWEYQIDLNNDDIGIYNGFDLKVSKLSKKNYLLGALPSINDNIYADKNGFPFEASGTYPIGAHKICWTVENMCGAKESCCKVFEIKDCQIPTPYCLTGLITVPIKVSGCVDISAKDLDHGSFDNCTKKENLKFFFDGDLNKTSIKICCEDFVKAGADENLYIDLEIWVEDEEGNRDFCRTRIVVTDELQICPSDPQMYSIIGQISGKNTELLSNVEISLFKNGMLYQTSNSNPFNFRYLSFIMNNLYEVVSSRNDDHLNGVSTADIIKIQRHVLGKVSLNSPYLLIAADVNNSKSITNSDISEIRKLIIGEKTEFTKVKSWTFVPMKYKFHDPEFPFEAPRIITFSSNNNISDTANFIGIKMGDVTENARAGNFEDKLMVRSNSKISLRAIQEINQVRNRMLVNFYLDSIFTFNGIQFTFHFDKNLLDWNGFESGQLNLEDENINVLGIDQGIITLSWDSYEPLSIKKAKPLFSFIFRTKTNHINNYNFSFSDQITKSEMYDENLNTFQLKLENSNENNSGDKIKYLSNPWFNTGKMLFTLNDTESQVELIVYDNLGKNIYTDQMKGEKGINSFELDRTKVQDSGIYYFEIITKRESKSGKMMIY